MGLKLTDVLYLKRGRIMMTGDPKRLARIFLNHWSREGWRILADSLPVQVGGEVFLGNPIGKRLPGFTVYLVTNPLSRSKEEREILYTWLSGLSEGIVLLYERKYIGDSITNYRIKEFIDYLVAYKRETVDTETVKLYRLSGGRVVEKSELMRRR